MFYDSLYRGVRPVPVISYANARYRRVFKRRRLLQSSLVLPKAQKQELPTATMNPIPTIVTLLVLGAIALTNVAGLPSQDANSENTIGGGSPWATSPSSCSRSEVWSRCDGNPTCQKTCDNYNGPIACTRSGIVANICYPGCVCKNGFVRVAQGDQCIPIDKCTGRVQH